MYTEIDGERRLVGVVVSSMLLYIIKTYISWRVKDEEGVMRRTVNCFGSRTSTHMGRSPQGNWVSQGDVGCARKDKGVGKKGEESKPREIVLINSRTEINPSNIVTEET
jgi:hypothetical protein